MSPQVRSVSQRMPRVYGPTAAFSFLCIAIFAPCLGADESKVPPATRPASAIWEWPRATLTLFVNDLQAGDVEGAAERVAFSPGDAGQVERELLGTVAETCKTFRNYSLDKLTPRDGI